MSIRTGRTVVAAFMLTGLGLLSWSVDAMVHRAIAAPSSAAAPGTAPKPSTPSDAPGVSSKGLAIEQGVMPVKDERKAEIKGLDDWIKALRDEYKSQADPLQAQLKSLREKLDADVKPLEAQRKSLVQAGETPELRSLEDEEASQMAALADREKAEIDKVRQHFGDERKALTDSFQKRRHDLLAVKK